MVLYDNKSNLVGVSQDTINFLGYEDIDELKTYTEDVANMFVKKSGYIHKFNDFSWIDYILHGGSSNKNAIIKLKNGKEEEVEIGITELISKENDAYYLVEFLPIKNDEKEPLYEEQIIEVKPEEKEQIIQIKQIETVSHEVPKKEQNNINNTQSKPQNNDFFQENLSVENLSFLNAHSLPISASNKTKKVDIDKMKKLLGMDEEKLKELVKDFFDYADIVNTKMVDAVDVNNAEIIHNFASELQGASELLGIECLSDSLEKLKVCTNDEIEGLVCEYQQLFYEIKGEFN